MTQLSNTGGHNIYFQDRVTFNGPVTINIYLGEGTAEVETKEEKVSSEAVYSAKQELTDDELEERVEVKPEPEGQAVKSPSTDDELEQMVEVEPSKKPAPDPIPETDTPIDKFLKGDEPKEETIEVEGEEEDSRRRWPWWLLILPFLCLFCLLPFLFGCPRILNSGDPGYSLGWPVEVQLPIGRFVWASYCPALPVAESEPEAETELPEGSDVKVVPHGTVEVPQDEEISAEEAESLKGRGGDELVAPNPEGPVWNWPSWVDGAPPLGVEPDSFPHTPLPVLKKSPAEGSVKVQTNLNGGCYKNGDSHTGLDAYGDLCGSITWDEVRAKYGVDPYMDFGRRDDGTFTLEISKIDFHWKEQALVLDAVYPNPVPRVVYSDDFGQMDLEPCSLYSVQVIVPGEYLDFGLAITGLHGDSTLIRNPGGLWSQVEDVRIQHDLNSCPNVDGLKRAKDRLSEFLGYDGVLTTNEYVGIDNARKLRLAARVDESRLADIMAIPVCQGASLPFEVCELEPGQHYRLEGWVPGIQKWALVDLLHAGEGHFRWWVKLGYDGEIAPEWLGYAKYRVVQISNHPMWQVANILQPHLGRPISGVHSDAPWFYLDMGLLQYDEEGWFLVDQR